MFLLLCAWILDGFSRQTTISCYMCESLDFCDLDATCTVFLIGFPDKPPSAAVYVVFVGVLVVLMLCVWFVGWFRRQATISFCMCLFFRLCFLFSCVLDPMRTGFLSGFAGRPPSVAICLCVCVCFLRVFVLLMLCAWVF